MNFSGGQSLNGLYTTTLFTAPAAGIYYVNGQLSLPQASTGASDSAVIAVVNQNGSPIYTGIAGARGFQVGQITCAAGDVINVVLSSSAAPDLVSNAVTGTVAYGNTF